MTIKDTESTDLVGDTPSGADQTKTEPKQNLHQQHDDDSSVEGKENILKHEDVDEERKTAKKENIHPASAASTTAVNGGKAAANPKAISFAPADQKPLKELSAVDLVMYRNIYASAILFLLGNIIFVLITRYNFSVATLLARALQFTLLGSTLTTIAYRLIKNTTETVSINAAHFTLSEELVKPVVDRIVSSVNSFVHFWVDLLLLKKPKHTLAALVVLHVLAALGSCISGHVLIFLAFLVAFTVPKFAEVFEAEIRQYGQKAIDVAKTQYAVVVAKIPPHIKEKIATAYNKVNDIIEHSFADQGPVIDATDEAKKKQQ